MELKIAEDGRPVYLQIMEKTKRKIAKGELAGGEKMLPVREMAIRIGVNPNTVAKAYMELEREGILVSKRGMGTFVTEDKTRIKEEKRKLALQCAERFGKEIEELGISMGYVVKLLKKEDVNEML